MDKIPGKKIVEKAEQTGNEVPIPMTRRRLGWRFACTQPARIAT